MTARFSKNAPIEYSNIKVSLTVDGEDKYLQYAVWMDQVPQIIDCIPLDYYSAGYNGFTDYWDESSNFLLYIVRDCVPNGYHFTIKANREVYFVEQGNPPMRHYFEGWYKNDSFISSKLEYSDVAGDITLKANYRGTN